MISTYQTLGKIFRQNFGDINPEILCSPLILIVEKDMFIYRFKQGKKLLIPLNIIGIKIKVVVFAPFYKRLLKRRKNVFYVYEEKLN